MRIAFALILAWVLAAPGARANEDPDTEVARRHFNAGREFSTTAPSTGEGAERV